MKTTRVVDTNVILRYLLADLPEHFALASAFMADVEKGSQTAYIPESVLTECVFVLLKFYRVPRAEIAEKLLGILDFKGVECENRIAIQEALSRFASTNLSIVDALVWTVCRKQGMAGIQLRC
jgi:predicted nucleic-acid-binding protein